MTNFPGAQQRIPDLYNLIIINKEITALEEDILDARYIGNREIIVDDTTFTDTTINTPVEFDNTVTGTANFSTNTEATVTPGNTFNYNSNNITFAIIVDGTELFPDIDTTTVISSNGTLEIGSSPTQISLITTMTLNDVAEAINAETSTTGIRALTVNNGSDQFFLRLIKDNTTDGATLIISSTTTATILTDLGLTQNDSGYVIDIIDVADQIGSDGSVVGAGPYNIEITNNNGVYVIGGTGLATLGLTKSINLTTDTFTINSHGFSNGDQVSFSSPGILPVPINAFPNSLYYVILVDPNNFKIATTKTRALEGSNLDITQDGTDYFTIKKTTDAEMYYQVTNGLVENNVFKQRMDEIIKYFQNKDYVIFRQTNPSTNTTLRWVIRW